MSLTLFTRSPEEPKPTTQRGKAQSGNQSSNGLKQPTVEGNTSVSHLSGSEPIKGTLGGDRQTGHQSTHYPRLQPTGSKPPTGQQATHDPRLPSSGGKVHTQTQTDATHSNNHGHDTIRHTGTNLESGQEKTQHPEQPTSTVDSVNISYSDPSGQGEKSHKHMQTKTDSREKSNQNVQGTGLNTQSGQGITQRTPEGPGSSWEQSTEQSQSSSDSSQEYVQNSQGSTPSTSSNPLEDKGPDGSAGGQGFDADSSGIEASEDDLSTGAGSRGRVEIIGSESVKLAPAGFSQKLAMLDECPLDLVNKLVRFAGKLNPKEFKPSSYLKSVFSEITGKPHIMNPLSCTCPNIVDDIKNKLPIPVPGGSDRPTTSLLDIPNLLSIGGARSPTSSVISIPFAENTLLPSAPVLPGSEVDIPFENTLMEPLRRWFELFGGRLGLVRYNDLNIPEPLARFLSILGSEINAFEQFSGLKKSPKDKAITELMDGIRVKIWRTVLTKTVTKILLLREFIGATVKSLAEPLASPLIKLLSLGEKSIEIPKIVSSLWKWFGLTDISTEVTRLTETTQGLLSSLIPWKISPVQRYSMVAEYPLSSLVGGAYDREKPNLFFPKKKPSKLLDILQPNLIVKLLSLIADKKLPLLGSLKLPLFKREYLIKLQYSKKLGILS